jgi:hypothetical protein
MDFFTVPTITLSVLYCCFVRAHEHCAITALTWALEVGDVWRKAA